jgi:hypothetical protein
VAAGSDLLAADFFGVEAASGRGSEATWPGFLYQIETKDCGFSKHSLERNGTPFVPIRNRCESGRDKTQKSGREVYH